VLGATFWGCCCYFCSSLVMQLIWNHLKPVSWLLAPVVGGDFVQVHVLPFLFFVPEAKDDLVAAKGCSSNSSSWSSRRCICSSSFSLVSV